MGCATLGPGVGAPLPALSRCDKLAAVTMTTPRSGHASVAERTERGKAARQDVPRSCHSHWEPAASRDPVALLEEQAETRLAELVPIRYGRMAASPFAFFRGAAKVMAADLADAPTSGISV